VPSVAKHQAAPHLRRFRSKPGEDSGLASLAATRDPESIARLNAGMRQGGCTPQAFDTLFGAGLDELRCAFAAAGAPVGTPAPAPAAGATSAEGIR